MATITFTIPDAQVARVIATLKWIFPIPQDANGDPLFTDTQWAKESIRRWVIAQTKRREDTEAKDAVDIPSDNTLIT